MREIKFRAWDKDNERFLETFDFVRYSNGTLGVSDNTPPFNKYGEIELIQYTGLKDKNGVEIYEGDIIQNQALAKREVRRTKHGEYKMFIGKHTDLFYKGWMPNTVWEVIGNIYENPELLK